MEEADLQKMNDHDLLISMHTILSRAVKDLGTLDAKVTEFNNNYVKKQDIEPEINDHELRIRRMEVWGFTSIGFLAALEFYFNYLAK